MDVALTSRKPNLRIRPVEVHPAPKMVEVAVAAVVAEAAAIGLSNPVGVSVEAMAALWEAVTTWVAATSQQ